MPECFIRGSTIKYLRIPDEVVDNFKEDSTNKPNYKGRGNDSSGGRGGRGGGNAQRGGRPGNARGGSASRGGSGRASVSSSTSNSSINKAKQRRQ